MTSQDPKHEQTERSLTRLLNEMAAGQPGAEDAVIRGVYHELRRVAQLHMKRERLNHTLQPTALVNEAYLHLTRQRGVKWSSRVHFLAVASNVMRHILVDYARGRRQLEKHALTVWHSSPVLHSIRAEDLGPDGVSNWNGVALTSWSGFALRPRNLFDSTPLYTPAMPPLRPAPAATE